MNYSHSSWIQYRRLLAQSLAVRRGSLVAFWPLTDLSGTAAKNLSDLPDLDGSVIGATLAAGRIAGLPVMTFDGVNDRVVPTVDEVNAVWPAAAGSVSLWCNPTGLADGTTRNALYFASVTDTLIINRTTTNNQMGASMTCNGVSRTVIFAVSGLVHIAVTWAAGAPLRVFVNGVAQTPSANTGSGFVSFTSISFAGGNNQWWLGSVGLIGLWSGQLNQAEVNVLAGGRWR